LNEAAVVLIALFPAVLVGSVVLWFERWRVANDWRYTALPWRRRRAA
jgi:hypothetical protein